MNCRIKIEELKSGEKRYIPQRRKSIFHVYTNIVSKEGGVIQYSLLRGIKQHFKTEQEALNVIEAYKEQKVKNVFYKLIS